VLKGGGMITFNEIFNLIAFFGIIGTVIWTIISVIKVNLQIKREKDSYIRAMYLIGEKEINESKSKKGDIKS
jgi:hypothetical protein